jgi:dethiobiotin synthetase
MKQFFITATDTDAGKTFVSCALIHALSEIKINSTSKITKVAAFKPVAAGCDLVDGELINEDAKLLSEQANCEQTVQQINPIAFAEPIAPHIAAKKQNKTITVADITKHYQQVKSINADFTLVEGAGGWRLPLGNSAERQGSADNKPGYAFLSDFVKAEQLKVVLIVNMKLGCLNHALLTYETIKADGLECVAWIANCASKEPMGNLAENINELEHLLPVPNIAKFDFIDDVDEQGNTLSFKNKTCIAASTINLAPLLS